MCVLGCRPVCMIESRHGPAPRRYSGSECTLPAVPSAHALESLEPTALADTPSSVRGRIGRRQGIRHSVHIADITMFYAPTSGGVRTYLEHKERYLATQRGIRHSVLVPGKRLERQGAFRALPALPLGRTGYRLPLRGSRWIQELSCLQPDLIEAGDPYRLAWVALAAGQRLGVPVIGFYHSDLPRLVDSRFGGGARRLAERYVRNLYPRFQEVLAPSRVMARQLRAMGVQQVTVQPLGVDIQGFNPAHADPQLRRRLGIGTETRLLVFAGRAAREKNIPLLLATARALGPAYHLLLIGPGMPRSTVPNVTVIDRYMPTAELARHLAACDALIHAGHQETFGLVVLEAMASGLPVIGIHAAALPELVVPGTGVLSPQATCDDLVDATRSLFSLHPAAMGRRARRRVEEHYAWEQTLSSLIGHYRRLLGQPALSRGGSSHGRP